MTKSELQALNTELIELLAMLRDQIDAALSELDVAADDSSDDESDDGEED